ncbi:unnamed protein product, partial [marine sediment metagenome]
MALTNFPDQIKVVIGNAWTVNAPNFSEDDVIVLTKVSGQDKWSEDGTEDWDRVNNRLMITAGYKQSGTYESYISLTVFVPTYTG